MARTTNLWLKDDGQKWLDISSDLPLRERATLGGLKSLMCIFDGAVPDRPAAIAARLAIPVQTWIASRKILVDGGHVKVTSDGLVIDWVMDLIRERTERCATNKRVAEEREAARRQRATEKPTEGELEASGSRADAEQNSSEVRPNSKSAHENNVSPATNVAHTKNHHHQTQNSEQEKHLDPSPGALRETQASKEGAGKDFHDSGFSIDDDDRPAKPLPASLIRALEVATNEERTRELVDEYLSSEYGRNRRHDGAFVKWLAKSYGIHISTRGSALGVQQLGEIAGFDRFGRPETALPDAATLAKRRAAATAPAAN